MRTTTTTFASQNSTTHAPPPLPHPSMAERDPSPTVDNGSTSSNSGQIQPYSPHHQQQQRAFSPGTYVVQVPKDQICRIPDPHHAAIAERRRRAANDTNNKTRCSCCCCLSFLVLILILFGILAIVFSLLLKYRDPRFSVQSLAADVNSSNTKTQLRPDYRMTLRAVNPNKRIDILYREGYGAGASLLFRKQEIAVGKYPSFFQPHSNTTTFDIIFRSDAALPMDMEKSLKNGNQKVRVSLSVKITMPVRLKLWKVKTGSKKFGVACDVMVDTLAKGTKILSQQCSTQRL